MHDAAWARRGRLGAGAGPLIGLRVSIGPGIWRIGPAWAVLAGALASGGALLADATPLRLVGAALLADSAWGVLWRLTASNPEAAPSFQAEPSNAPYYRTHSPAGRALQVLREMVSGATWHELTASIALTAVLGLLLGIPALLLSLVAWGVVLWAWVLAGAGKQPAACDALLNIGLPWLLGIILTQPAALSVERLWPAQGSALALGLVFTVLQWGIRRAYLSDGQRTAGAWLGHALVLILLVGLQRTFGVAIVALLFLPPAWWLWQARSSGAGIGEALSHSGAWWLAAMLISAFTLR
jgi:hypothetical protein